MKILHISDLHFEDPADLGRRDVLDAFFADLESRVERGSIDLVAFTGDLVFAGKDESVFEKVHNDFVLPLMVQLELDLERLVLCPGNHDIDRDEVNLYVNDALSSSTLTDIDLVNGFIDDASNRSLIQDRLAAYYAYYDRHWSAEADEVPTLGRTRLVHTSNGSVAVAMANSAWRATGRADDVDYRRLLLGERQLQALERSLEPADLRLLLAHHPLDWLQEKDAERCAQIIPAVYDLALFGHMHKAKPFSQTTPYGTLGLVQVGSLYESPRARNSYAVIDVDLDQRLADIQYRSYESSFRSFDIDTQAAREGRQLLALSEPEQARPRLIDLPSSSETSPAVPSLALEEAIKSKVVLLQEQGPEGSPLDLLIRPRLFPIRQSEQRIVKDSSGTKVAPITIEAWAVDDKPIAIFGARESGKTCALAWTCIRGMRDTGRLGILLDFPGIAESGKFALRKAIRRELRKVGVNVDEALSDCPPLIVAVDNFPGPTEKAGSQALAWMDASPSHKFVVALRDNGMEPPAETWDTEQQLFRSAYSADFASSEIRALVEQLYPDQTDEWDAIRRAAFGLMMNQGLARTPTNVVMVLMIFRFEPSLANTDVTSLVDKYVDLVLGKWQVSQLREQMLDHVNRRHFLTNLAAQMVNQTTMSVRDEDLLQFARSYLSEYSIDFDAREFVDDLIRRRVLGGTPERIGFIPTDLMHFFVAEAARADLIQVSTLLEDLDLYMDSLIHLSSLTRQERGVLEALSTQLSEITSGFESSVAPLLSAVDPEAWGSLPGKDETLRMLERYSKVAGVRQNGVVEDAIADEWLTQRDEISAPSTDDLDVDDEGLSDEERAIAKQIQTGVLILKHVATLSLCLVRSELVADQTLKVQLFDQALQAWAQVYVIASVLEDLESDNEVARRREQLAASGMTKKQIDAHQHMGVFFEICGMAVSTLNSAKFRRSYSLVSVDNTIPDDDLVSNLILTALLVRSDTPGWSDRVARHADDSGSRPQVMRVLNAVLATKYFDRDTSDDVLEATEVAIAGLSVHWSDPASKEGEANEVRRRLKLSRQRTLRLAEAEIDALVEASPALSSAAIDVPEVS